MILYMLITPAAAFAAYRNSSNPFRFLASYIVFTGSIVPTIFGWIIFLYPPALLLLTIGVIINMVRLGVDLLRNRQSRQA